MPNGSPSTSLEQKFSELDVSNKQQDKKPSGSGSSAAAGSGGKYVPPNLRNKQATSTTSSNVSAHSDVPVWKTERSITSQESNRQWESTGRDYGSFHRQPATNSYSMFGGRQERTRDAGGPFVRDSSFSSTRDSSFQSTREGNYSSTRDIGRFHAAPRPRNAIEEAKLFKKEQSAGIRFEKYAEIPVEVSGVEVPNPISTFGECSLNELVQENVALCGYTSATPVQQHAFPIVLSGRDLMACAQTGSGKTAAFLVPILSALLSIGPQALLAAPKGDVTRTNSELGLRDNNSSQKAKPFALVVAPTRELAIQIYEEALKFAYRSWVRPCVLYGGAETHLQMRQLSGGADLLVATPGRLLDMLDRGRVTLSHVRYLVLDEADRMLDMGFEPDIRRLVDAYTLPTRSARATLLFSATFPRPIQLLARDFLRPDYVFLQVGKVGASSENIAQRVELVQAADKKSLLLDILDAHLGAIGAAQVASQAGGSRILVFLERKRDVDILEEFLYQQGYHATSIHGDRTQSERERALQQFRAGSTPILLATAVASRGLDIPNVNQVVLYDFPTDIDDYVHRIGRTGRAGNLGSSVAFFTEENRGMAKELLVILKEAKQPIPKWLPDMASSRSTGSAFQKSSNSNSFGSGAFGSGSFGGRGGKSRMPFASSSSASASSWSQNQGPLAYSSDARRAGVPSRQTNWSPLPSNASSSSAQSSNQGAPPSNAKNAAPASWEDLDSAASFRDSWY